MSNQQIVLIGYFPKRSNELADPHNTEIGSISEPISKGPDSWISRWKPWILYDSGVVAREVTGGDYDVTVKIDDCLRNSSK